MNTKNLIITPTKGMTREQWLAFRQPINHVNKFIDEWLKGPFNDPACIEAGPRYDFLKYFFGTQTWADFVFPVVGASEVSSILGYNDYKSVIELFYEKVGLKEPWNETNAAMFWGKELEEQVAQKWQYWEGSEESVFQNFEAGNVVRRCRRCNAYVQNKNFPWLFCSLDRIINRALEKAEGSLECKTISGYSANKWQEGIPPMYVVQLQDQLLIFEFQFGELAILKDGREFLVYPFDRSEKVCERLLQQSKIFFYMVKAGIEQYLLYMAAPTEELKERHLAAIHDHAPEPDGSVAYEAYLKDAYKEKGYEVVGSIVHLHYAKAYKYYDQRIKQDEARQRECSNKLKDYMKDAAKCDFGPDGSITWKEDKNQRRAFRVNVSFEPDFKPDPELLKTAPLEPELSTLPEDFR